MVLGNTDASGWAPAPFPVGWPVRCFGLLACNVAGDSIASAIAGVKRLNDRDMQVTLMERSGVLFLNHSSVLVWGVNHVQ